MNYIFVQIVRKKLLLIKNLILIAPERENKAIDLIYLMFVVGKKNITNTLFVFFSIKAVTMDISDIYPNICGNIRHCSGF